MNAKQFDDLIIQNKWDDAIEELEKLGSEGATHLIITTMFSFDRTADDKDWEAFNKLLADRRPYPIDKIPNWCRLPTDEHLSAGGCWSIATGRTEDGTSTCENCEYDGSTHGWFLA